MSVLLAAEADRIQGYLFRSARLREVVGGSQLLGRFCERILHLLGATEDQVITSGGGSFYLTFDSKEEAKRFGAALAELYYRTTGSTLSVAEPVTYDGNYGEASKKASKALRQAKQSLGGPLATVQFPHIAFCESCGIGLAERHQGRFADDPRRGFICSSCLRKAEEQWHGKDERKKGKREPAGQFLKDFYSRVRPEDWNDFDWPGRRGPGRWTATAAEDVARFDPRDYVAYIVADGNGMGQIFDQCQNGTFVRELSKALTPILQKSLAKPAEVLMEEQRKRVGRLKMIPVLPLIMDGDDLFALVPAPWALDIAGRFCRAFETHINEKVEELAEETGEPCPDPITITASVVICKRTYPYYLAHEVGEKRLGAAKRVVKALANKQELHRSAMDVEFIVSSQLPRPARKPSKRKEPHRRATLRPYWVAPDRPDEADETSEPAQMPDPSQWGMAVDDLLIWRHKLSQEPSRQLSRLRELYDPASLPQPWQLEQEKAWASQQEDLVIRASRDYDERDDAPVIQAFKALGGERLDEWPRMHRTDNPDEDWYGHALPDLLRVWDFAFDMTKRDTDYEGGER